MPRICLFSLTILVSLCSLVFGQESKARQTPIRKGLSWLAAQQDRDGGWPAPPGQCRLVVTAAAGLAFRWHMDPSEEGEYHDVIRRASDWMLARVRTEGDHAGLISESDAADEEGRYVFGHALALKFLSVVYGETPAPQARKQLREVITLAARFSAGKQSRRGGWSFASKPDSQAHDDSAATVWQLAGLRAARNAGIPVPKEVSRRAFQCFAESTGDDGGIPRKLANSGRSTAGSPMLTAAVLSFYGYDYKNPTVARWLRYCARNIPLAIPRRADVLLHYYYARAMKELEERGWDGILPDSPLDQPLTWERYRDAVFPALERLQDDDGSWPDQAHALGRVLTTALVVAILQQDYSILRLTHR